LVFLLGEHEEGRCGAGLCARREAGDRGFPKIRTMGPEVMMRIHIVVLDWLGRFCVLAEPASS